MLKTVYIPKALVAQYSEYARCSGDRSAINALCLFICVKLAFGSSALTGATIKKVGKMFGVGFEKARQALAEAKSERFSGLFDWNEEKSVLTARRVIDRPELIRESPRSGRKSVQCIRFYCDEATPVSFRSVERQMRQGLALDPINAIQRFDKFSAERQAVYNRFAGTRPACANREKALSITKMSRIMHVSRSTAHRELKAMEAQGIIKTTVHPIRLVLDKTTGEALTDDPQLLKRRGFEMWCFQAVRDCNDYEIVDLKNFRLVRFVKIRAEYWKRDRKRRERKNHDAKERRGWKRFTRRAADAARADRFFDRNPQFC